MAITYSNYIYSFSTPSVPRISVNMVSVSQEELTAAITAYNDAVDEYVSAYSTGFGQTQYVQGRFEKDTLADVGMAVIDKHANTYTPNIKADNYFVEARSTTELSSVGNLTDVHTRLGDLVLNLAMSEDDPPVLLTDETGPVVPYDPRAVQTITIDGTQRNFLLDVPNATGTNRTYTAYDAEGSPEYTLTYTAATETALAAWQVRNAIGTVLNGDTAINPDSDTAVTIVTA